MKYLITFEKGESARWLGHLDILRTFERAIRRANLPIAFSAGFNPHERIAFANALSVGVTGSAEPAVLELTTPVDPGELVLRLNEKLPPGIQLRSALEIPDSGSRDLLNRFDRAEVYMMCVCAPETTLEAVQTASCALMARTALIVEREREGKIKKVDLRPLIHQVAATGLSDGRVTFALTLSIGADGTAKPAEIAALLATDLPGLAVRRVHRVRLLGDTN